MVVRNELTDDEVDRILAHRRGWTASGRVSFRRVDSAPYDFVVRLASPGTTDKLCAAYGLRRPRELTIYDIKLVAGLISDVVNVFGRARRSTGASRWRRWSGTSPAPAGGSPATAPSTC